MGHISQKTRFAEAVLIFGRAHFVFESICGLYLVLLCFISVLV